MIKKTIHLTTLVLALAIIAISCQEVPVVLPEPSIFDTNKTILVEDVTGVDCSNCPRAAERLDEIAKQFEGNVIIVGIHGDQQSAPIKDKSKYDFRHEDARILENYLRPWAGKPASAFNRVQFDGEENFALSTISAYQARVEELLAIPQTLFVGIDKEYNPDTRELTIDAEVIPLVDLEGDFHFTVMITESHIIDYQLDPAFGGYDPDYEHNHVLRDVVTTATGDKFSEVLIKDEPVTQRWRYTIPSTDDGLWVLENLDIIIAVTDHSNSSKRALQSAITKVLD